MWALAGPKSHTEGGTRPDPASLLTPKDLAQQLHYIHNDPPGQGAGLSSQQALPCDVTGQR